jgi:FkbM family methyltransferase
MNGDTCQTQICRYGSMTFPRLDQYIGYSLAQYGEWAQLELEMLLRFVFPGSIVVDVGANVGSHSLAFARAVGKHGVVYAFEPQPFIYELLKKNIESNNITNVRPNRAGVGRELSKMWMDTPDYAASANFSGISLSTDRPRTNRGSRSARIVTIDSLALHACSLIKIDAEGMELDVLVGARKTIRERLPVIFAECTNVRKGWNLVTQMRGLRYAALFYGAAAFNCNNFLRKSSNPLFGSACETGLLFVAKSSLANCQAQIVGDPNFSLVENQDDLVRGLLKKPQYREEVAPELIALPSQAEKEERPFAAFNELTAENERLYAELLRSREALTRMRKESEKDHRRTEEQNKIVLANHRSESEKALRCIKAENESKLRSMREETNSRLEVQQNAMARFEKESEAKYRSLRGETKSKIEALSSGLVERQNTIDVLNKQLQEIISSRSWKFTKPLRVVANKVRLAGKSAHSPLALFWALFPSTLRRRLSLFRHMRMIRKSGLFDSAYYLQQYPDVAAAGKDPLIHYLESGAGEGRNPSSLLDTRSHVKLLEGANVHTNPIVMYSYFIKLLRRGPLFDSEYYLNQYPDVAIARIDPIVHFILAGATEGRDPSPLFDTKFYLEQNPDVRASGINPLAHFIIHGKKENRSHRLVVSVSNEDSRNRSLERNSAEAVAKNSNLPASLSPSLSTVQARANESETWSDYQIIKSRIARAEEERLGKINPRIPGLVHIVHERADSFAKSISLPEEAQPIVSIVIPARNGFILTLECLAAIVEHSIGEKYEVILVDDGSTDRIPELAKVKGITYLRNAENKGFVATCNRGARKARGQYVVFLNNDTQPAEGWLGNLVETFRIKKDVGAVGPKILFPDGRLQEAGNSIYPNMSVCMVGLNDDPTRARYNYLRQVEYCSGACLMVGREHFLCMGGFAADLAPGYYEDVELQLRLRKEGLNIYYNPNSTVVHHLSATNLEGPTSDKQRYVLRNSQYMREKWGDWIDSQAMVRLIAFYFPQFHAFPENEFWWGRGFTEWTNVSKAQPNFVGHYQPHLPGEMGFYDLRVPEVLERQAELARSYGIHGFCFFYYWFAGKRLMEKPLERLLDSSKPDIPFCLSWANENWTRRWDGGHLKGQVMIAQEHSEEDDKAVIKDLMRYFRHPNYIRVKGKPMLLIYRVGLFPEITRTVEIWRDLCRRNGIGDIYLVRVESFDHASSLESPESHGFDAAVEYPPHHRSAPYSGRLQLVNPEFRGSVNDYRDFVLQDVNYKDAKYTHFRAVMPSWDNTARRQNDGVVFWGSTPGAYQASLETAVQYTFEQNVGEERVVFVNAWNEWAEGAHLEPDRRFGRAYLEATRNALKALYFSRGQ